MSYFRPWRRKLGLATLVIACVFTGGWVRSVIEPDYVQFQIFNTLVGVATDDQNLELLIQLGLGSFDEPEQLGGSSVQDSESDQTEAASRNPMDGLPVNLPATAIVPVWNVKLDTVFRAPFWLIVTPLTTLSAWLLLSKPRQKPAKVPE